jgi:hypothetical protein
VRDRKILESSKRLAALFLVRAAQGLYDGKTPTKEGGAQSMTRRHNADADAVPKAMLERYREVSSLTDVFCRERLNDDYATLSRRAIAALCRKRPSPVMSGKASTWACAVVYALGRINFLDDKSTLPFMRMQDVCAGFGVAPSTGGNKAKAVRDALGMGLWDHRWMLPDRIATTSPVWLLQVNGFILDIRDTPRPLQVEALEHGLIPYLPADGPEGDGGFRDSVLDRYGRYRSINLRHQSALAVRLVRDVADTAVRLGMVAATQEVGESDLDDLTCAADFALYANVTGAEAPVARYAGEIDGTLGEDEKRVLGAMGVTRFSIFHVGRRHRGAGVDLRDLISGEQIWLVDRGLEATAYAGTEIALRIFRPDDFWMTTGVGLVMDPESWRELSRRRLFDREKRAPSAPDQNVLAEALYRFAGDRPIGHQRSAPARRRA